MNLNIGHGLKFSAFYYRFLIHSRKLILNRLLGYNHGDGCFLLISNLKTKTDLIKIYTTLIIILFYTPV